MVRQLIVFLQVKFTLVISVPGSPHLVDSDPLGGARRLQRLNHDPLLLSLLPSYAAVFAPKVEELYDRANDNQQVHESHEADGTDVHKADGVASLSEWNEVGEQHQQVAQHDCDNLVEDFHFHRQT